MGFGRLMEMVNGIRRMYGSCPLDCTRAPEVPCICLKAEIIQAPLRLRSRCTSPLGARRRQHQKTNGWSQVRLCLIKISAVPLLQLYYDNIARFFNRSLRVVLEKNYMEYLRAPDTGLPLANPNTDMALYR